MNGYCMLLEITAHATIKKFHTKRMDLSCNFGISLEENLISYWRKTEYKTIKYGITAEDMSKHYPRKPGKRECLNDDNYLPRLFNSFATRLSL